MVRKAERLHRVFEDFAAAVVGLRDYIADGEREDGFAPGGPDPFYEERVAPLALETLALWVDRVKGLPRGPKGEKLASSRPPSVLDKVRPAPAACRRRRRPARACVRACAPTARADAARGGANCRLARWPRMR
jgi:hypothetical protein